MMMDFIFVGTFEYFALRLLWIFDNFESCNFPPFLKLIAYTIQEIDWTYDKLNCLVALFMNLVLMNFWKLSTWNLHHIATILFQIFARVDTEQLKSVDVNGCNGSNKY